MTTSTGYVPPCKVHVELKTLLTTHHVVSLDPNQPDGPEAFETALGELQRDLLVREGLVGASRAYVTHVSESVEGEDMPSLDYVPEIELTGFTPGLGTRVDIH